MYKGEIPFDKNGQPMYYPTNSYLWEYNGEKYESGYDIQRKFGDAAVKQATCITVPPKMRPNIPFRAVLKINDYSRGRSAANFDLEDRNGIKYTMFLKDFLELVQKTTITKGETEYATWCFCKRGQNYGLQLMEE